MYKKDIQIDFLYPLGKGRFAAIHVGLYGGACFLSNNVFYHLSLHISLGVIPFAYYKMSHLGQIYALRYMHSWIYSYGFMCMH